MLGTPHFQPFIWVYFAPIQEHQEPTALSAIRAKPTHQEQPAHKPHQTECQICQKMPDNLQLTSLDVSSQPALPPNRPVPAFCAIVPLTGIRSSTSVLFALQVMHQSAVTSTKTIFPEATRPGTLPDQIFATQSVQCHSLSSGPFGERMAQAMSS